MEETVCSHPRTWHVPTRVRHLAGVTGALLAYSIVFAGLFVLVEGWTFVDALYFAVISGTGVGYGDVAPTTFAGR